MLVGARGDDVLDGGAGNDLLQGGLDADTFRFERISIGAIDVICDFDFNQGDQLLFGPGISVLNVEVSRQSLLSLFNGTPLVNRAQLLDLVITLGDGSGATQTLHVLDAYSFGLNGFCEAELGFDLSYPRPLPLGINLVPIA